MKTKLILFLTTILCSLASLNQAMADSAEPYRLHQGDVLMVSVWGEATLQKDVRVLPDGSITFPLAGRVEVGELTTPEAEMRIAEKLKVFLPEPQVTVVVTAIEGNRAYIIGKVLKPGPIPVIGPLTVLQALSMAGGLDKFAEPDAIKVLRPTADGQEVLPVNYNKLIQGQGLDTNFDLKAGDTILVP